MDQIYIIGDVHGCYKTLMALVKKLPTDAKLVFVGDLIDRGFHSNKVIEFVRNNYHHCVLGNHELAMKDEGIILLNNPILLKSNYWTNGSYGGIETIKSYRSSKTLFNNYKPDKAFINDIEWLESLPYFLEFKDIKDTNGRYLVVSHSAVSSHWENRDCEDGTKDKSRFYKSILFSRDDSPDDNSEIFNVFGHTPVNIPVVTDSFANIDTGCVFNDGKTTLGVLTALEFPSKKIFQQKNIE